MPGPRGPFHASGEVLLCHVSAERPAATPGIHFSVTRQEDHVNATRPAQAAVPRQITRIAREVLPRPELHGIDEDADDHLATRPDQLATALHERQMPRVQI